MNARNIVYALLAVWAVLIVASFSLSVGAEAEGDGFTRGLNRVTSFLTWQAAAFVVSISRGRAHAHGGGARRRAHQAPRATLPLAATTFMVGVLVVTIAFRVLVLPAFA